MFFVGILILIFDKYRDQIMKYVESSFCPRKVVRIIVVGGNLPNSFLVLPRATGGGRLTGQPVEVLL